MPCSPIQIAIRGDALLNSPRLNKGSAFALEERKAFGLSGRLPSQVNSLEEQYQRAYGQLQMHDKALQKNSFMQSLRAQNWTLYYTLLERHLKELMPIIYTPTEADAISYYSHLFRRSEGMYLTLSNKDSMESDFLEQTHGRDIDLIVCTDSEAILGIGDQGVGGIGISVAKAILYTALGGIDPSKTLSVVFDVGTNNDNLLNDPLYVGWRHKRVSGMEYDAFIDKFVRLVQEHHPHCLLHFEDFGVANAYRFLARYRHGHAVINDDIQGTGAVTLAALMAAIGVNKSKLQDQKFIIFGAGTAGLGIATQIRDAMIQADHISKEEANLKIYLVDKYGLLKKSLDLSNIRESLHPFARTEPEWGGPEPTSLVEVVRKVWPTALIGCSTKAGAFNQEVVKTMAAHCDRPIIFPLSNPSRLVEVTPQNATTWADGKALIATGSPFPPIKMPNGKYYEIAECNNALIFPGLGLGCLLSKSRCITDGMILAGSQALAKQSPALEDPSASLLPDFQQAPRVNFNVALSVAMKAIEEGVSTLEHSWIHSPKDELRHNLKELAKEMVWKPEYKVYNYNPQGETD